ncbi:MAG: type II secretion system inner membrane protein GspF [Proteobacteria bacterium]|uniref:type II secretion system inner membrane protein GspF n=1 Tax=Rudaea sp. TaxID=2136325 RepID=UPI001DECA329|nr:type II secretion system inner membrane protein GspF [Pseudomonadota bacterium]MBS0566715.1 type II secretion system inner membrane protein GspF [Pseudomonadota bacterium]
MPLFRYKAVTADGEIVEGQYDVASENEAVSKIQDAGNIPLEVASADGVAGGGGLAGLFKREAMNQTQVLQFTQQLATLLGAGQPLDRALQILLELPESEKARRIVERIRDHVRGGAPLSEALEAEPGVFTRLYVNMVRAGEVGGALDTTLARLATYLERAKALKESVVNAMIYPAILVVMVFAALVVLLVFVVPQFMPMFKDMNVELPFITQIVLFAGTTLQSFWWLILALVVFIVMTIRRRLADPEKKLAWDARVLTMRVYGPLVAKLETARLARTLGTLLKNGVPLLTALGIGRNVLGNTALAESVDKAAEDVKTGGGLAHALAQSKRFPKLATQMISVGEESGSLDDMLLKVADTFDIEAKNTVDRMLAGLVPVMTLVMTGVVGFIMMAILLPIMSISGSIQ